jgi:hypothetical protein
MAKQKMLKIDLPKKITNNFNKSYKHLQQNIMCSQQIKMIKKQFWLQINLQQKSLTIPTEATTKNVCSLLESM